MGEAKKNLVLPPRDEEFVFPQFKKRRFIEES